jgi:glycosyltransferase involved in cell wall biosynthesis
MLRGLRENGVGVTAIAARQTFSSREDPPPELGVEVVDVAPEPGGWGGRLGRLERPRGWLSRGAFGARVRELAAHADVLYLDETQTAWCSHGTRLPAAVHVHYLGRMDTPLGRPWRPGFRQALEIVLSERAATRRHRHFVASSPRIAEALGEMAPNAEVVRMPLSLDPARYRQAPLDGPPVAGIIGTAAWPPTRRALERLVGEVWPAVRRRVPDARLLVAGRGTSEVIGARAADGVEALGEIPSAVDFLSGLSLLLYPLPRGSGMKVKVLEAIAMGLPVVTTACGAEGIDSPGVVIRADDAGVVDATAELLLDATARAELGRASRASFLAEYAPAPATEPLAALFGRMAASGL